MGHSTSSGRRWMDDIVEEGPFYGSEGETRAETERPSAANRRRGEPNYEFNVGDQIEVERLDGHHDPGRVVDRRTDYEGNPYYVVEYTSTRVPNRAPERMNVSEEQLRRWMRG